MVAVSSDEYIAAGRDGNVLGLISCPLQNPSNFYEYQWRKHGSTLRTMLLKQEKLTALRRATN